MQAHWYDWGLALDSRSLLRGRQAAPPWMRAELVRLQAAFPEFSFGICPGWRGPVFEAWRETGTGDLYAVITARRPGAVARAGGKPGGTEDGCRPGRARAAVKAREWPGLVFALEGVTGRVLRQ